MTYDKKYLAMTHYHPIYQDKVKIKYTIEYTEKDEDIDINYSNLKTVQCEDFEKMIEYMFRLRQNERHNISLYLIVEELGGNNWLVEDTASDCGYYLDSKKSVEIKNRNIDLNNQITELSEELETYKEFIKMYHAEETFKKYKEENKIKSA